MRHPYRTSLLAFVAVFVLTGCSTAHAFQLFVKVISQDDGKPVKGATVKIDTDGKIGLKDDPDYGLPHEMVTDAKGEFEYRFTVTPYPSDRPHWFLKVWKDGYELAVIDIKPDPQPERSDTVTPIEVTVVLKPRASGTR